MEVLTGNGITILADTYNANPLSMKAALLALDEMGGEGRRIAVLADMLELGENSAQLHREVGSVAARHCDLLIVLGEGGREVASGALQGGMAADRVFVAADHDAAVARLEKIVRDGDRIVVKGSRGMKMERVTAALRLRGKG